MRLNELCEQLIEVYGQNSLGMPSITLSPVQSCSAVFEVACQANVNNYKEQYGARSTQLYYGHWPTHTY